MITALANLKENADRLSTREGFINLLVETFSEIKPQVEDKVIEQLKRGERGDGSILPNYSQVSVARYGKPAGPIKIFETGATYQAITLAVSTQGLNIYDADYKEDILTHNYGEELFDLQTRSIDELKEDTVLPILRDKVLKTLLK